MRDIAAEWSYVYAWELAWINEASSKKRERRVRLHASVLGKRSHTRKLLTEEGTICTVLLAFENGNEDEIYMPPPVSKASPLWHCRYGMGVLSEAAGLYSSSITHSCSADTSRFCEQSARHAKIRKRFKPLFQNK